MPKGQNLTARSLEHFYYWDCVDELRAARLVPPGFPIGGITAYGSLAGSIGTLRLAARRSATFTISSLDCSANSARPGRYEQAFLQAPEGRAAAAEAR